MSQEASESLQTKVNNHEISLNNQMTEIVKLQRQVSGLADLVQHLFVLVSSVQRFSDEQETAFKEIPKLLKQIQEPEV